MLGADKGKQAEGRIRRQLAVAVALRRAGLKDASDPHQSLSALNEAIEMARKAIPNWPRASRCWEAFIASMV